MASIEKIGHNSYRIKYYLDGKTKYKGFPPGTPKHILQAVKKEIEAKVALHKAGIKEFVEEGKEQTGTLTLAEMTLMMYHFWRIRKDGGLTIPRTVEEVDQNIPADSEKVTTIPHLVQKEMIFALGWVAAIIIFAALVPAPLEGIADPNVSPNPAKAPWYFMGLQEMLLHFHPVVAALIIPGVVFTGVLLLPFYDVDSRNIGVYFRSTRGRGLSFLAAGLAFILTPAWVLVDEFLIDWSAWLPAWDTLITNGLVPLAAIVLPLILLDQWVKSAFKADTEERVVFIFVFLFTAFLILTIIGIFFRGPGMSMYLPWAMPAAH